jgi:hypothetical protein
MRTKAATTLDAIILRAARESAVPAADGNYYGNHNQAVADRQALLDILLDDTRDLGVCLRHRARFTPGYDCPECAAAVERLGPNAAPCAHRWPDGEPMACSVVEQVLTADEAMLLGLDPTGRNGDQHFPWRVGHLTPAQQTMLQALWDGDLCSCGHPGYDGHDMRSVPPECLAPDCECGRPE